MSTFGKLTAMPLGKEVPFTSRLSLSNINMFNILKDDWHSLFEYYNDDRVAEWINTNASSIDRVDNAGHTLFSTAVEADRPNIVRLLLHMNILSKLTPLQVSSVVYSAIDRANNSLLSDILQSMPDINYLTAGSRNPLIDVLIRKRYDLATLLISAGMSPDAVDSDTFSEPAIVCLIKSQDAKAVRWLIEHGASTSVCSNDGRNVSDLAIK